MRYSNVYAIEEKEQAVLRYINEYKGINGFSPTIREICKFLDIPSTSTIHGYIHNLIAKGLMTSLSSCPRTMNVNSKDCHSEQIKMMPQASEETVQLSFNLGKYSIAVLNNYCIKQGVTADEALEDALSLLERAIRP